MASPDRAPADTTGRADTSDAQTEPTGPTGPNRRTVLRAGVGVAAGAAGVGLLGSGGEEALACGNRLPANPAASGIDHIVVVMMENRSFDHYFGWAKGANGRQAGLTYTDRDGARRSTYHLTDYQGCAYNDPDHSFEGGRSELNGGRCDGWLRTSTNDRFSIGYYQQRDLAFYGRAVPDWTIFDNYYSATMAETYPNRFYQHSAQTDRTHNSTDIATMPTIWDRLAAKGVSGRYYFCDVPFLSLYGAKYVPISRPYATFLADAATGNLPAVSFVDPKFLDEGSGSSADDHPHADIRAGQAFLNSIYKAVTTSPNWARTALVINYDEWGGFFDHVAPSRVPDARPDLGTGLRGFRVPAMMISPRARRGHVAHGTYDHASVLKMIEWRFGLPDHLQHRGVVVGAEDDRVALRATSTDPAGQGRREHRRGARLLAPAEPEGVVLPGALVRRQPVPDREPGGLRGMARALEAGRPAGLQHRPLTASRPDPTVVRLTPISRPG